MPRTERPDSPEGCAELLRACADSGRTVRVRGGGTKDHLGTRRETAVVLETAGLAGIVGHGPQDPTVTPRARTRVDAVRDAPAAPRPVPPLDAPPVARGAARGGILPA